MEANTMRKMLPYLGASLTLLAAAWSTPVLAQDQSTFKDVPTDSWAYQAVSNLQSKGIIVGYPDGYFRGKRTLTRYEFAEALDRAIGKIQLQAGPAGSAGPQGDQGPPGPAGPAGMTPEEVTELKNLADEFKTDLANLGANVNSIDKKLDTLSNEVNNIQKRLNRMPKIGVDLFSGFTSAQSRYPFIDQSGSLRPASKGLFSNVASPLDIHVLVSGQAKGRVKYDLDIFSSNYLGGYQGSLGSTSMAAPNGSPQDTGIYKAELNIPINGLGKDTELTVGRFGNSVTPLTYMRPYTDAYFNLPWYNDGNWIADGFRLSTKIGKAETQIFADSYTGLTGSSMGNGMINTPTVGQNFSLLQSAPGNPLNRVFAGLNAYGTMAASQSAGVHVGLPLFKLGQIGLTAIDFNGITSNAGIPFANVVVYGVNFEVSHQLLGFKISGEAAKSVRQADFSHGINDSNDADNAFTLNAGYNHGRVNGKLGYIYIDPNFGAPGSWLHLGQAYNPTNVQGPVAHVGYHIYKSLSVYVGAKYLSGARNRAQPGGFGFTTGSFIGVVTGGVKYALFGGKLSLGADYEGDFYNLSGAVTASGKPSYPIADYVTLSAGLKLAGNTSLDLAYQMLHYKLGGGLNSNASIFTTGLAVHF